MLSNTRQPCDEAGIKAHHDVEDCGEAAGRWVLAAAIIGSSITFIDGTVVNVALPVLQSSLGASVSETQWIVEAYSLTLSALILVGGSLGDRLGRRRIFSLGVLLFGAASVWCGVAPNITQLIVARGVQGIGAAMLVPGSLALISANFSKKRRGRAIGTWSGISAVAAGIGPVLGGWLVQNYTWRWIFWINVPLCVMVLAIAWFRVPESKDGGVQGAFDWAGPILATAGLGGVVLALVESNSRGWSSPLVIASMAVGLVSLVVFAFVEAKMKQPMMPPGLFRERAFSGANLLTLFLYAGLGGLLFFLPFNLIQVQHYSPTVAGAALLPFVLTMFILSRWAGGLVDRYGSRIPLVVGPLIAGTGFALFAVPGAGANNFWTGFFPAIMVMSVGMSISVAPLTTTVMGAVDESHAGIASGINNAVSRTAGLLAVAVFGVVMVGVFGRRLEQRLNSLPIPQDVRETISAERSQFVELKIPDTWPDDQKAGVKQLVDDSFVEGFRTVSIIAAALAALSAFFAWLLIDGKGVEKP